MQIMEIAPILLSNDLLSIARLYLEKYDLLADEDKKLYRDLILSLANPPLVVKDECVPQSILEEREIEAHNARCAEFLKKKCATPTSWPAPTPLAMASTIDLRWHDDSDPRAEGHNNGILEAFRRGQSSPPPVPEGPVCPECARHGHEGIPATRDRHSDYPGDGNCSVCGGYCDQSS